MTADLVRRTRRRPSTVPINTDEDLLVALDDTEAAGIKILTHISLKKCLERLSEEQRQVILLRFIVGLSAREVGRILRKSDNAVNTQQSRALVALRKAFAREGYDGI